MPKKKQDSVDVWNGNKFAARHGAYLYMRTGIAPGCSICAFGKDCDRYEADATECSLVLAMQDSIIDGIMALPHIQPQDIALVEELARTKGFLWVIDRHLAKFGPFAPAVQKMRNLVPQSVLKLRWVAANSMTRLCSELGLSPVARARLKLGDEGFDLAKAMATTEVVDAGE